MRSTRAPRTAERARDLLGVAADRLGVARGADVAQVERLGQQHRGGELLAAAALGVASASSISSVWAWWTTQRSRPSRLAAKSARLAARMSTRRRAPPARGSATPTETETGHGKSANSLRTSSRRRSATASAARLAGAGEHERELLAAQPRRHVGSRAPSRSTSAKRAQHLVAGVVAERVVDALEVVEVADQQRQLAARPSASIWASMPGSKPRRLRSPVSGSCSARWRRLLELARGLDRAHRLVGERAQRLQRLVGGQQPVVRVVDPHQARRAGRRGRAAARRASGGPRRAARARC